MKPLESFHGAQLKLQRAKEHITHLDLSVKDFNDLEPYRIVIKRYADGSDKFGGFLQIRAKVPAHFALIVGDAIHNLHTALDHAVCAAVRDKVGAVSTQVQFPFAKSTKTLEATISQRQIHLAGPKVVDVIRGLNPYPGGNDDLCVLHDLDILDKHQLILPVAQFPRVMATFTISQNAINIQVPEPVIYFDADELIDGMEVFGNIESYDEADNNLKATLEIAFGKGPLHRKSVIPTLHQLARAVEEVVSLIDAAAKA